MGLQIKSVGRKNNLIISLIAVFALIAQPMYGLVASHVANAATHHISTEAELRDKLATANSGDFISLGADITISEPLVLSRPGVSIYGQGHTISYSPDASTNGWNSEYVLHVYRTTGAHIRDITLTGGDAGLLVNGSQVSLLSDTGRAVDVSGNEFGGIEVSKGAGVTETPKLSFFNGLNLINTTETATEPTIWTDGYTGSDWVDGTYSSIVNPAKPSTQRFYYLNPALVPAAEVTHVDAYYLKNPTYTAIGVDFKTMNVTDATAIEVRVNRVGGGTYSVFATPDMLTYFNSLPDPASTSAVVVITGSRTSGAWTNQTGTWSGQAAPESVDVIATLGNGDTVTLRDTTIGSNLATWEQVKPADTSAPQVQFINAPQFVNSADHKFQLTATDVESGVANWRMIFLNEAGNNIGIGSVPCSPQTQGNSATATCYANANLDKFESGKTYAARAYAKDKEGNEGFVDHKFTVDTSLPQVQFAGVPATINPTSYKFNLTATDTISGVNRWQVVFLDENGNDMRIGSVPCTPQTLGSSATATCFVNADFSKFVSGKTYTARAIVTDKAGNIGYAEQQFTADTVSPTIDRFEFQNASAGVYNPTKVVARAVDGDGAGVTNVYINVYKKDANGDWKQQGGTYEQGNPNGRDFAEMNASYALIKGDGTYMLESWAKDAVGNVGEKRFSHEFVVDSIAPVVAIDSFSLTGDLLEVTVSGEDALSGLLALGINIYDANNEGDALVSGLGRIKDNIAKGTLSDSVVRSDIDISALTDGTYTIRAVALDHAGLYSTQALGQFTVDRTAPAVSIDSMTFTTTGARTITGTVDDDATSVEASIDNGTTWIPATYTPGQTTWSFPVSSGLANGSYPILARATDNNGNTGNGREASAQASFTVAVVTNPAHTPAIEVNNSPQTEGTFTPNNTAQSVNALQVLPAGDTVVDSATDEEATDEDGEVAAAVTDNDDNGEVKAAEDVKDSWSLINLLLTIAVAAASIFALIGLAGKKEDRNIGARLLTVVPALGAGAVLLFAEDFTGQMSWVNIWTLLVGALLVVQMIILANTKSQAE